jgi:hypothetical protein
MERHGAVVLLAGLADWDAALLKRAALGVASEWTPPPRIRVVDGRGTGVRVGRVSGPTRRPTPESR